MRAALKAEQWNTDMATKLSIGVAERTTRLVMQYLEILKCLTVIVNGNGAVRTMVQPKMQQ